MTCWAATCDASLRPYLPACAKAEPSRKGHKEEGKACPEGQEAIAGHCCWPGQGWSSAKGCVGEPQCPRGFTASPHGCAEEVKCPGGKEWDGTNCVTRTSPPTPARPARYVEVAPFNPARGPEAASVTVVEWADFQCPFCRREEDTLRQLRETYGARIRWVWRNDPLPFHARAADAAKAALAAANQGKFWEMHDWLFADPAHLEAAALEQAAGELGLHLATWRSDRDSSTIADRVRADTDAAAQVGVNGTPTFFVNGILVMGAQPYDAFKAVIDDQLQKADALRAKGVPARDIAARLMAANVAASPPPSPPSPSPTPPSPCEGFAVEFGGSPSRGPASARVTIVMFGDFQCPFSARAHGTLAELERQYAGRLRVVFKQKPLPFHTHAEAAAEASLAANEQGRFWEMYDQLFQNQQHLTRPDLERYAEAIGLDPSRFGAALDRGQFQPAVQADLDQADRLGISGTPTFVINGIKLVGAQPIEAFRKLIDAELASP